MHGREAELVSSPAAQRCLGLGWMGSCGARRGPGPSPPPEHQFGLGGNAVNFPGMRPCVPCPTKARGIQPAQGRDRCEMFARTAKARAAVRTR